MRELAATAGLVLLALADPRSESWFSRPGAWERWAQLGLAVLFGVLVFAAAVSGFRNRYSTAALLVIAAGPTLSAWLLVVT